jgi:hypothetical protein
MEPEVCRSRLQALHDLGDVLLYEDQGVALFWNMVILESLLLIDFFRRVINLKNMGQNLATQFGWQDDPILLYRDYGGRRKQIQ